MCRFFDVSRSEYYGYVQRIDIVQKIKECQDKCDRTYGYHRVHIWLERQGIHRNPKTILCTMQKYTLLSSVRRKKYRNYGNVLHKYPNLLNRDFTSTKPNWKWVTDISYIHHEETCIRDLFDNSIESYKIGTKLNINLVLSTIRAVKRKEKITADLQLHSDQGIHFSKVF